MAELVGLGFADDMHAFREGRWLQLANNVSHAGEFEVSGSAVQEVLEAASSIPAMNRRARILWHTHTETKAPSFYDTQHFPWFVDMGLIFHVPTRVTTLYNSAGTIQLKDDPESALETPMFEPMHGNAVIHDRAGHLTRIGSGS